MVLPVIIHQLEVSLACAVAFHHDEGGIILVDRERHRPGEVNLDSQPVLIKVDPGGGTEIVGIPKYARGQQDQSDECHTTRPCCGDAGISERSPPVTHRHRSPSRRQTAAAMADPGTCRPIWKNVYSYILPLARLHAYYPVPYRGQLSTISLEPHVSSRQGPLHPHPPLPPGRLGVTQGQANQPSPFDRRRGEAADSPGEATVDPASKRMALLQRWPVLGTA